MSEEKMAETHKINDNDDSGMQKTAAVACFYTVICRRCHLIYEVVAILADGEFRAGMSRTGRDSCQTIR